MSFLAFINDLRNKPIEIRMGIFVGLMIFSAFIVFVVFGFSVKNVLSKLEFTEPKSFKFVEDETDNALPSVREMIKASVLDLFRFKDKTSKEAGSINKSIDDRENLGNKGYKLPDTE